MAELNKFWDIVLEVWESAFWGSDLGRVFVGLGILFLFFVLRHLFSRFVIGWLRAVFKRTKSNLDDKVIKTLEAPARLIPVVLGIFFAGEYMELEAGAAAVHAQLVRSLIVFILFWGAYNAIEAVTTVLGKLDKIFSEIMVEWIAKAVKYLFIFLGAAIILEIWGIEVGPLVAGLGLFGVAVALGAQDLFKNLISGILVIMEHRFSKGDWIKVDGVVEGTVEAIGFRSTVVRRFDKAPVYVPNAKFSDNAVTNFSAMTHRRIYWKIGVEYRTSIDQLKQVRDGIESYVLDNEEFAQPTEVSTFVRVDSFNDSSIDLMLYCFTKTTDWGEWLEIKERLAYAIKDIVEGAGSGFAFPSQSIYLESMPEDQPEAFVPPKKKEA